MARRTGPRTLGTVAQQTAPDHRRGRVNVTRTPCVSHEATAAQHLPRSVMPCQRIGAATARSLVWPPLFRPCRVCSCPAKNLTGVLAAVLVEPDEKVDVFHRAYFRALPVG